MAEFLNYRPDTLPFNVAFGDADMLLVGTLAAAWSQFEFLVTLTLGHYAGLAFDHGRNIERKEVAQRLAELSKLADALPDTEKAKVQDICKRGTDAALCRNLVFHGQWLSDFDAQNPRFMSWFKVPANKPPRELPATELAPLITETATLGHALADILREKGLYPA